MPYLLNILRLSWYGCCDVLLSCVIDAAHKLTFETELRRNNMKNPINLTLALVLSLTGMAACADSSRNAYDLNRDGIYSGDEFTSYVDKAGIFTNRDLNKDGLLDEKEYNELGLDEDFQTWDRDKDSYLSASEFNDGTFKAFDDNEDGHWDGDEWDDAGDAGLFDV